MLHGGAVVTEAEGLEAIRTQAKENIERLHPTIRRFMNPHAYPVGLDIGLYELRDEMVLQARRTQLDSVDRTLSGIDITWSSKWPIPTNSPARL